MARVLEVKDGFIQMSLEDSKQYSTALRRLGEILYTINGTNKESIEANWLAYKLEHARTEQQPRESREKI